MSDEPKIPQPIEVSERKREANRRNAQLSTGPKTEEGKAISRFNATTHGLVSRQLVHALGANAEGRAEYDLLISELREAYQPQTVIEELLVEKASIAYWRLKLGASHERTLLSKPSTFYEAAVDRLGRYMAAANREFYQAIHELERIIRQRLGDHVPAPVAIDVQTDPESWPSDEPAVTPGTAEAPVPAPESDEEGVATEGALSDSSEGDANYETKPPSSSES